MGRRNDDNKKALIAVAVLMIVSVAILWCGWKAIFDWGAGPVKGDPAATMAQWREYERLARKHPAK